LKIVF